MTHEILLLSSTIYFQAPTAAGLAAVGVQCVEPFLVFKASQENAQTESVPASESALTAKRQVMDTTASALTGRHQPAAREDSHLFWPE
jgi:hypothetical protein